MNGPQTADRMARTTSPKRQHECQSMALDNSRIASTSTHAATNPKEKKITKRTHVPLSLQFLAAPNVSIPPSLNISVPSTLRGSVPSCLGAFFSPPLRGFVASWLRGFPLRPCAILLALFVSSAVTFADAGLDAKLRPLFAKLPEPQAVAGAVVIDLTDGKLVFEHNADQTLVPASAMKVFVMAAGLAELGPDFAFDTILATDGARLIVIGDGDPAFGDEKLHKARSERITADFDRWAAALAQRGFRDFPGGLLIDESVFDTQWVHPSWEPDDLDNWYAAPIGALNFNDNCVDITVIPDAKLNAPARITVQPEASVIKIINQCKSGGKGTPVLNHLASSFEYVVSGRTSKTFPLGAASFPDPGLLFAESFRTVLARSGVRLAPGLQRARIRLADGSVPSNVTIIDRKRTPLPDVLSRIGKDSQNFFAECLLKRMAYGWARRQGRPDPQGSWSLGSAAVGDWLTRQGVPSAGFVMADGSGLSRENRCSARQLATLLGWVHRQPYAEVFQEALSEAGEDGSLRKRLKDVRGSVYCKTGTMRGIRALTGYVHSKDGRVYAFASIFNNYKGGSAPYKEIQDRLCRTLAGTEPPKPKRR